MNLLNNRSSVFFNVLWLGVCLLLAIGINVYLFGIPSSHGNSTIQLYDTYFVFPIWYGLLPIFLLILFVIFLAISVRTQFGFNISNSILMISGLGIIAGIGFLLWKYSNVFSEKWNILPPMSAMKPDDMLNMMFGMLLLPFGKYLFIIQMLVICVLLYTTYRWGSFKNNLGNEYFNTRNK